jgi:long-chain acyl-CoA synthetase
VRSRHDLSSLRTMIHGAAPCPPEVKRRMLEWWGPVVVEYYAATEGGGTTIMAEEWLRKPGSVGRAWPGSVVKVLDDDGKELPPGEPGLVYMRMGTSTFQYHRDAEKTRAARVGDLFTLGDVGHLDEDGYLTITDRLKDILVTAGGKNVAPQNLENALKTHAVISQALVVGDRRPYIAALITLSEDVDPNNAQPAVQNAVDEVNAELSRFEQIKRFTILPRDFTLEAGEVTPTLKLKRRTCQEHFAAEIEDLYS